MASVSCLSCRTCTVYPRKSPRDSVCKVCFLFSRSGGSDARCCVSCSSACRRISLTVRAGIRRPESSCTSISRTANMVPPVFFSDFSMSAAVVSLCCAASAASAVTQTVCSPSVAVSCISCCVSAANDTFSGTKSASCPSAYERAAS